MMYEVIRWDESIHNSKGVQWKKKEEKEEESAGVETLKCFDKRL